MSHRQLFSVIRFPPILHAPKKEVLYHALGKSMLVQALDSLRIALTAPEDSLKLPLNKFTPSLAGM